MEAGELEAAVMKEEARLDWKKMKRTAFVI
jgi:hypothetical protein